MQTTEERQNELQNNYYFLCKCERCSTNYEQNFIKSMMCPNTKCQAAISMENRQEDVSYFISLSYMCITIK